MNNTTTLEAINDMLATIGEAPINTLAGDQTSDVATAVAILNKTSRSVQKDGWGWNTEYDYVLALNDVNHINIPDTVLHVEFKYDSTIDPVRRGKLVYDRKNKSFDFTKSITAARLVWFLEFEVMPQAAKDYVSIRAAREFAQKVLTAQEIVGYTEMDEAKALASLTNDECRSEDHRFAVDQRITGRNR